MCTTCGCGEAETKIDGADAGHWHRHADGTWHSHNHQPDSGDLAPGEKRYVPVRQSAPRGDSSRLLHFGYGPAGAHAPGLSQARMLQIETDILSKNDAYALENRKHFRSAGVFVMNLVSSPGSGKTTLLVRTIEMLKARLPVAVIEGDQQTSNDADRIRATGAPAVQINTGKGCHLDAHMVGQAAGKLELKGGALFIENVGNLVCPAAFDLGEACKVAILSVTEGEDKPLKYPDMFRAAGLMLLNKCDLLPYLRFDTGKAIEYARRINPNLEVMQVSAETGAGFDKWLTWIEKSCKSTYGIE